MRKTVTATIVTAALMAAAVNAHAVQLRGARSCGEWTSDKGNVQLTDPDRAWALGLLSGMAFVTGKDVLRGTDNEAIFLHIDTYCRAKPLESAVTAIEILFDALAKQKGL